MDKLHEVEDSKNESNLSPGKSDIHGNENKSEDYNIIELTPISGEKKKKKKHPQKKKKHPQKKEKGAQEKKEEEDPEEEGAVVVEKKKEKKQLQDVIANFYIILTKIGQGAFGQIYLSYNLRDGIEVAIKKEPKKPQKQVQLKTELKVYQALRTISSTNPDNSGISIIPQEDVQGVPRFYGMGELPDSHYLIIEFLGPNLIELFNYCKYKKFTISTVCLLALQMLNRIEWMHRHHFIHRDIKPENFVIGSDEKSNILYLIDFGLSKRYKNAKNSQHIPYREGRLLTGTARYVSINTHLGIEQSRRDDLESIGYVLVFFLKGSLPWQGMKTEHDKYLRIMEKKLQIPTEILCYGLPDEIAYYLTYCKSLRFEDRPDYDYLRGLFVKLLGICTNLYSLTKEHLKFDWCFGNPQTIWMLYNRKKGTVKKLEEETAKNPSLIEEGKTWGSPSRSKENTNGKFVSNAMRLMTSIYIRIYLIKIIEIDEILPGAEEERKENEEDIGEKTNENNPNQAISDSEEASDASSYAKKNSAALQDKNRVNSEKSDATVKQEFSSKLHEDFLKNKLSEKQLDEIFNNFGEEDIDGYLAHIKKSEVSEKKEKDIPGNSLFMTSIVGSKAAGNKLKNSLEIIRSNRSPTTYREGRSLNAKRETESPDSAATQEMKKGRLEVIKTIQQDHNDNSISDDSSIHMMDKKKILDSFTATPSQPNNCYQKIVENKGKSALELSTQVLSALSNHLKNQNQVNNNNNNISQDTQQAKTQKITVNGNSLYDMDLTNSLITKVKSQEISNQGKETPKKVSENILINNEPVTNIAMQTSATNKSAQIGSNEAVGNQKSFECEIIQKISSNEIKERRRSKILDISNNLPQVVAMKLSKDTIIKISTEPITKYYTVIGELGHGSYGQVKRVMHRSLGEERAMKIVNKRSESSQNEIEILRKISHPNILSIYEIFEDSKKYYIMSELLEGGELFEVIVTHGSFSEGDACRLMKQILSAVNYLHSRFVVHRDLKPENIMLVNKQTANSVFEIKIIDFGTAKQFEPNKKLNKFIGTSYYIAPEVLDENYDEKCDVWSCGVILYILLSGFPPFNGSTNVAIYQAIKNSSPDYSSEEWKEVSKDAIDLIKQMLVKQPAKRYSAEMCLKHRWFKLFEDEENNYSTRKARTKNTQLKAISRMEAFVKENKLKQAVLQFITSQFNLKDEENILRSLFKQFDTENKGFISNVALTQLLSKHYGENDAKDLSEKIFTNLDLDGSGEISYNEFLTAIIDRKKVVTEDRMEKAFKMFDKDGNGKISADEITSVFGGDEDKWRKIIEEVDINQDGEIDFEEFKNMMIGCNKHGLI